MLCCKLSVIVTNFHKSQGAVTRRLAPALTLLMKPLWRLAVVSCTFHKVKPKRFGSLTSATRHLMDVVLVVNLLACEAPILIGEHTFQCLVWTSLLNSTAHSSFFSCNQPHSPLPGLG